MFTDSFLNAYGITIPTTFLQAKDSPEHEKLWEAMKYEMDTLNDKKNWSLAPLPK